MESAKTSKSKLASSCSVASTTDWNVRPGIAFASFCSDLVSLSKEVPGNFFPSAAYLFSKRSFRSSEFCSALPRYSARLKLTSGKAFDACSIRCGTPSLCKHIFSPGLAFHHCPQRPYRSSQPRSHWHQSAEPPHHPKRLQQPFSHWVWKLSPHRPSVENGRPAFLFLAGVGVRLWSRLAAELFLRLGAGRGVAVAAPALSLELLEEEEDSTADADSDPDADTALVAEPRADAARSMAEPRADASGVSTRAVTSSSRRRWNTATCTAVEPQRRPRRRVAIFLLNRC
mmetsp:Transcript_10192/g.25035  ORF Transcript_10192/g.25035 Transcript_10192/m.25035 type:complete len:286 (+) Transcript_10192:6622-7479(+)